MESDGTQAVFPPDSVPLFNNISPFFLSFNNLPGGQRLCWPELLTASFVRCGTPYVVVREWLESEHKQPTEENVVSAGGFGFLFASL